MSRMPNWRLRYEILKQMYKDDINVSDIARRFRASKVTIYRNIDEIKREIGI